MVNIIKGRFNTTQQLRVELLGQFICMIQQIILSLLITALLAQTCLKSNGEAVAWWIIMKVPPKIGNTGYGYYDSTMRTAQFVYSQAKVDLTATALTKTMEVINLQNLEHVAWNDEKPTGQTSSTSGHSKGFISYSIQTSKGFFISHSIPKYPSFVNGKVSPIIAAEQNYYGQHISCFSLTLRELDEIASRLLITWPYIYESQVSNTAFTTNLYKLGQKSFTTSTDLFLNYDLRSAYGYSLKTIFKNDKINCSIFQDGLRTYLQVSPLIAETWGRPIANAWCYEGFQVLNVVNVTLNGIEWAEQDDHSKWVLAGQQYACFGDMNHMKSQWKRGGAFYCLSERTLIVALTNMIKSRDQC